MRKVLYVLGKLSDEDLDWLISQGERRNVSEGTLLIEEGKQLSTVYILISSCVAASTSHNFSRSARRMRSTRRPGEQ